MVVEKNESNERFHGNKKTPRKYTQICVDMCSSLYLTSGGYFYARMQNRHFANFR